MIVERNTISLKVGKIEPWIELWKAQPRPEITQRLYIAQTGRRPQVVWEGEFESDEERVKWWQSWLSPSPEHKKASEYVDHWETQFLTLVE